MEDLQIGGEVSGHGLGTSFIKHSVGTAAFLEKDDVIRVDTYYTQNFNIANGSITLIYLGGKGK